MEVRSRSIRSRVQIYNNSSLVERNTEYKQQQIVAYSQIYNSFIFKSFNSHSHFKFTITRSRLYLDLIFFHFSLLLLIIFLNLNTFHQAYILYGYMVIRSLPYHRSRSRFQIDLLESILSSSSNSRRIQISNFLISDCYYKDPACQLQSYHNRSSCCY